MHVGAFFDLIERAETQNTPNINSTINQMRCERKQKDNTNTHNIPAWTIFWSCFHLFDSSQFPQNKRHKKTPNAAQRANEKSEGEEEEEKNRQINCIADS